MMINQIYFKVSNKILSESEIDKEVSKHFAGRKKKGQFVEVEIVGEKTIKSLNLKFMKKNCPTDVLSFPLPNIPGEKSVGPSHIGTIVLCNDIIKLNAKKRGRTEREEFIFILKHGLDHLLGIHHN